MPMTSAPPISVAQAADDKHIPKRTIQAAIARGELKAHKMPGATGAYWTHSYECFNGLESAG